MSRSYRKVYKSPWQCVEVGTGKEYTYFIDWFDWAHPVD